MKTLGVIPARLESTRLSRKPLAMIGPKPMVQWVYDAAAASGVFDDVVVATDSDEVAACVSGFGGRVELTSAAHRSGTDRVAEVAANSDAQVVANVQGDQPFVTSDALRALVSPFSKAGTEMTTIACPLVPAARTDPNTVKVILRDDDSALLFTRATFPYREAEADLPVFHHLGLYAFTREFLAQYANLSPTPLEQFESLEQLRALEHGYRIHVARVAAPLVEVNTPEDLARARGMVGA